MSLLEDRVLLAPTWVAQGPAPVINGQEDVPPRNEVTGAIQTVAAEPGNADRLYIGSVNGGVWRTDNATAAGPTWTPLTDDLPSLSIGALEFDPTDSGHQTLIAGIGNTSSFFGVGSTLTGVLRTTDRGATWTRLGQTDLLNENITSVAARGNTLLAASDNTWPDGFVPSASGRGLFRSTDGGVTFQLISGTAGTGLPAGSVSDLVGDPASTNVLYAAVLGSNAGIFQSTDTGATWTDITSGITGLSTSTTKIEMAVHDKAGTTSVYVDVLRQGGNGLVGVFRSLNGAAFIALDLPSPNPNSGGQGYLHHSIAADPTNSNIVYIGGDSGPIFRLDASQPAGSQVTQIVGGGFKSPHVDTREMGLDANGDLIMTSDGGIFRLKSPTTNSASWQSVIGNLAVIEFHDIAYDSVSNIIMGGTQDNGTVHQLTAGNLVWDHAFGGDGGDVAIDDLTLASSGRSSRYFSSQNLGHNSFDFRGDLQRCVYDASNSQVGNCTRINTAIVSDPQFVTPVVLNAIDPQRMIIGGTNNTYESLDQGTTFATIGSGVGINGNGVSPIAYGGKSGGVPNLDVLYVGFGKRVFLRTTSGGSLANTSYAGGTVNDIVLDPDDWKTAYVVDPTKVWRTTDGGANWTEITGDLADPLLVTIELVPGASADAVMVGGMTGVHEMLTSAVGTWVEFGLGLPNAPGAELEYDATDDLLLAGTLGRGAWTVANASTFVAPNRPPSAKDDSYSVNEDTTLSVTASGVLGNDSDPDGDSLTAKVVSAPSHAKSFKLNSDGSFDYTPDDNYNGPDSFKYKANDGREDSSEAIVSITVNPVNDKPVGSTNPASLTIDEDAAATTVTVGGLDVETGQANLTFTITAGPASGTLKKGATTLTAGSTFTGSPTDVTYQSAADFNGTDSFKFKVSDRGDPDTCTGSPPGCSAALDSDELTLSITVNPVNDKPTASANPAGLTIDEDAAATTVTLSGSDLETGNANLTFKVSAAPASGTLKKGGTVLTTGSTFTGSPADVTYQPAADFNGTDSFKFKVVDRGDPDNCSGGAPSCSAVLDSGEVTVSITVKPLNDRPTASASPAGLTMNEDAAATTVTLGGSDVETGKADLTFKITAAPANGTLKNGATVLTSGSTFTGSPADVTYQPNGNFNGSDNFKFKVADRGDPDNCGTPSTSCTATLDSTEVTVPVTVNPANDKPTASASPSSLDTEEGAAPATVTLSGSDPETAAANLSFTIKVEPSNGILRLKSAGTVLHSGDKFTGSPTDVTYQPNANFTGLDSLKVKVTDRGDPDNCGPPNATCTPALDSDELSISITVTPFNIQPTASESPASVTTGEDGAPTTVTLRGSDVETALTNLTFVVTAVPAHGTLRLKSNNQVLAADDTFVGSPKDVTYQPDPNFNGSDTFGFKVTDRGKPDNCGQSGPTCGSAKSSDPATVPITVSAVNDQSSVDAKSSSGAEDQAQTIGLSGSDIDSTSLTFKIQTPPSHGTLGLITGTSCSAVANATATPGSGCSASVTYTPNPDYNGPDSFSYVANDGSLDGSPATVTIAISPEVDAPVARDDIYFVDQDSPLGVAPPGVMANDVDVDGHPLSVTFVRGQTDCAVGAACATLNGQVTLNTDGSFIYTPNTGFAGSDSFAYQVTDGTLTSGVATVQIAVSAFSTCGLVGTDPASGPGPLLCVGSRSADRIQIDLTQKGSVIEVSFLRPIKSRVIVPATSVSRIIVRGLEGNDVIRVGSTIAVPSWLFGGPGNDQLLAARGSANNVVVGGDGNDVLEAGTDKLKGGEGRDILIGGRGKDHLKASAGDNLLVAGFTDFDSDPAALASIQNEWSRTDLSYQQRIDHLLAGGGLNGSTLLNPSTAHDDGDVDLLDGAPKSIWMDWFLANLDGDGDAKKKDKIGGLLSSRIATDINLQ